MYIEKLVDENIGPIGKVSVEFPFCQDGRPKPIIFVGENGSGKSTLLSNIVDSLYTIATVQFNNAMQSNDHGAGYQYYKAIIPTEIKIGNKYLYSYIRFKNNPPIQYLFKSGKLSVTDLKHKVPECSALPFSWDENGNFKKANVSQKDAEKIFETDAVCYFGPDRYEKPLWMGGKYFSLDDHLHPTVQANWSGVLKNPISVKNVTETNLRWLLDVIVDSRSDIRANQDGGLSLDHINVGNFNVSNPLAMGIARKNLETILSKILGTDVYFSLSFRDGGASRFMVMECETNKVIVPTLDSLSTGQIALFNMFSTIVRYADNNDVRKSISLNDITGIAVIDEIELHLHTSLQKEVLPKLIKLFPRVQFVITSHAPLFLLGMQEEFGNDGYEVYEMPNATKISVERFSEFQRAYDYFKATQTYQRDAEAAIEATRARLSPKVMVITEGATDWKHMKTAMVALKEKPEYSDLFCGLEFEFLEYEPSNSQDQAPYKLEMGNKTLTSICENYAKMPHQVKYIFIADCDVEETTKKLGDASGRFKRWSNGIYSFTIPVPESRRNTPKICIEHLYSNDEIKTEVEIEGVKRRLYIGSEFDSRGLAIGIDRFCERANVCGPDKINIIEGTQGDRITSIKNTDGVTNYALSKMNFAKYVSVHPDDFKFDNFVEIFKTIKEIVYDGMTTCQNM